MTNAVLDPAVAVLKGELAAMQARITMLERNQRSAYNIQNTSIDGGALTVNDASGNAALLIGLQADGSYGVAGVSTTITPADVPDAPAVFPALNALTVLWDGLMGGAAPSMDFAEVQVHCSTDPNFIPSADTLQTQLTGAGQFMITGLTAGTTYYVALVSVNIHGSLGTPSAVVAGTPLAFSTLSAQIGGVNVTFSGSPPASPNNGDLWYNLASQCQLNQFSGGSWQPYQFGTAAISAGSITAGLLAAGIIYAGIVNGTTISGAQFIAYGTNGELLIYSGPPAAGNLIGAWSAAAGSDNFSNAYPAGDYSWSASGVSQVLGGQISFASTLANLNAGYGAFIQAYSGYMKLTSGVTSGADNAIGLSLLSKNNSGGVGYPLLSVFDTNSTGAAVSVTNGTTSPSPISNGVVYWADSNSRPAATNDVGSIMRLASSYGQAPSGNTNATTSMNALTPAYAIAAGDVGTNSVFRFSCGGHGTQGSTVQNLNWQIPMWTTTFGGSTDNGGLAASQSFHWHMTAYIYIGGSGTAAPVVMHGEFTWSAQVANATGRTVAMDTQRTNIDVTQLTNISFQAGWASITGGPTITCIGSLLERMGG